jgi:hypothetical protein
MGCTALTATPDFTKIKKIGYAAFAGYNDEEGHIYSNKIASVNIPANVQVGDYAFFLNTELTDVTLGNGVTVGEGAFSSPAQMLTIEYMLNVDPEWTQQNAEAILQYYYERYDYEVDAGGTIVTLDYYAYNLIAFEDITGASIQVDGNITIENIIKLPNKALTFDEEPVEDSKNLVTSDGIYRAIKNIKSSFVYDS